MKQYIVTEKQLRKLKEILDSDAFSAYWSEETREMKWIVEDIEAQEMSYKQAHKRFAEEAAMAVELEETADILRGRLFLASALTATWYEPHLENVPWSWIWASAKEAEKEKPGAAYDVFMKVLEGGA